MAVGMEGKSHRKKAGRKLPAARTAPSNKKTRSGKHTPRQPAGDKVPLLVAASPVFQRVPHGERRCLDRAILTPAESGRSLKDLAAELKLGARFGITSDMLEDYASKLTEVARPLVTSQVMAAVVDCLPRPQRRSLFQGGQVVLLSKVLESLNSAAGGLSVPDMAKLASVLTALARSRCPSRRAAGRSSARRESARATGSATFNSDGLAEAVKKVYGI